MQESDSGDTVTAVSITTQSMCTMNIGVPKEIKVKEERVGLFPGCVRTLVKAGHSVVVEKDAGKGCSLSDELYTAAGATIGDRVGC